MKSDGLGWWVTGLTDGEGCFIASLSFRSKATSASRLVSTVELSALFTVVLRADDVGVLEKLRDYFGCGVIYDRKNRKPHSIPASPQKVFMVRDRDDLLNRVIPHFRQHPLQSKKAHDFDQWAKILLFVEQELGGKKGWLRRFPGKVEHVGQMCASLSAGKLFAGSAEVH